MARKPPARRVFPAVLSLLLLSACAGGGATTPRRHAGMEEVLQNVLERWRSRDGVHAATMAVDAGTYFAWEGASGLSDVKGRVESSHRFPVASVTKLFVATVIMQLADEGKLFLDAPVSRWVPDAPHGDGVTIRQLLQHRSGIPESQGLEWARDAVRNPEQPWSRERLMEVAAQRDREFKPGTRFGYSNTNYLLLDDVIRAVTGTDWGEQVRRRIIERLRLSDTSTFGADPDPGAVVEGYVDGDGDGANDEAFRGPYKAFNDPAGGIISSGPDLVRFARSLFGGELLRAESMEELLAARYFTPSSGYGLGVQFARPDLETTMVGHTGGMPGFTAALMHIPELEVTIAALANDGSSSAFDLCELAFRAILDHMKNPLDPPP
jgi:D-alanyl-D-alanine carboxypeptidase